MHIRNSGFTGQQTLQLCFLGEFHTELILRFTCVKVKQFCKGAYPENILIILEKSHREIASKKYIKR